MRVEPRKPGGVASKAASPSQRLVAPRDGDAFARTAAPASNSGASQILEQALSASEGPDPSRALARARKASAVVDRNVNLSNPAAPSTTFPSEPPGVCLWSFGQALGAALDQAQLTRNYSRVDALMKQLENYRQGEAYAAGCHATGTPQRYYDDNAWIGLDFMQAYNQTGKATYLREAEALFPFFSRAQQPDGGMFWQENAGKDYNTCAMGSAAEFSLQLYLATRNPKYLVFARKAKAYLQAHLREPGGLYADRIDSQTGVSSKAILSYNQGVVMGMDVLLYRATGDKADLQDATTIADRSLEHFGSAGLWREGGAFNAIFFRNLLQLDSVAPDPRYKAALNSYLDRAWSEGRDARTGFFDQGGIGSYRNYGGANLVDQAGLAQLFCLAAWPESSYPAIG